MLDCLRMNSTADRWERTTVDDSVRIDTTRAGKQEWSHWVDNSQFLDGNHPRCTRRRAPLLNLEFGVSLLYSWDICASFFRRYSTFIRDTSRFELRLVVGVIPKGDTDLVLFFCEIFPVPNPL